MQQRIIEFLAKFQWFFLLIFFSAEKVREMVQWASNENLTEKIVLMLVTEGYDMETITSLSESEIMQLRKDYEIQMADITRLREAIEKLKQNNSI